MKVKCNMCEELFDEKDIVYDGDDDCEYCPHCGESGYLMDYPETVDDFAELYGSIPDPYGYKMEVDDVEHNVIAVCRECGDWVGTFLQGYGWSFSSKIDFGRPYDGLCDSCAFDHFEVQEFEDNEGLGETSFCCDAFSTEEAEYEYAQCDKTKYRRIIAVDKDGQHLYTVQAENGKEE